ncbi:hypothetical protein O6H91_09G003800 [Diphasiastrum complanatum]|uniref:Uncharacterized protein n=1 Tax=Diphasiastrum complanatum TaxID=34168 RepID=A0ACC2CKW6_DIPCM|nr:hypothetical protein O6H91_09G003800 [Diphasiastrum complanatum]
MLRGRLLMSFISMKRKYQTFIAVWSVFFSAAALAFFLLFASRKFAVTRPLIDRLPGFDECSRPNDTKVSRIPRDLAIALLHFATTAQIPQQTKEEINVTLQILQQRRPCNFLVVGMWHDSLLWAVLNHGGRTVFLDESQEWIDRMREKHPQLETYKVDYHTTLGQADGLLEIARNRRSTDCSPNQPIERSSCPLSLSPVLPRGLLTVEWDVILIDGPRSYKNLSFPGRMSPIFSAAVMARTRTAPGHVDVLLHDISRSVERQYGEEFLCLSNLVSSVNDLWHFRIGRSNSSTFCPSSS